MWRPALVTLVFCGGACRAPARMQAPSTTSLPGSNILRADYVGSAACIGCHATIGRAWERSPMHRMTRLGTAADVRAPFDGTVWRFKDDEARLTADGSERFVEIRSSERGTQAYRVTRIIGGRTREDFAGIEVEAPRAGAPAVRAGDDELVLPLTWVFGTRSFRLKGYSVLVEERPGLRAGGVWNRTCIACHNTLPYFTSILGELHGPGAPGYQGEVVDRVMPAARRWGFAIGDETALALEAAREVAFLGGEPTSERDRQLVLRHTIRTTADRLGGRQLVEVGIGCESCHGGGREHVEDTAVLPSYEPRATFLRAVPPAGAPAATRALLVNRTCARCHQVLFSRYAFTWEGGLRHKGGTPGGSHINSGEARDFLLGGCTNELSCVACHDPHGEDTRAKLDAMGTVVGNTICTTCHAAYRDGAALRAHTHHKVSGVGSACLSCHMPRKNMGLDYGLTRYHRIASPTDRVKVEGDRPLECALCHADKSVADLVGTMERWWGKRYDRAALRRLYGDLGLPALEVALARGKPHEKATALAALGDARRAPAAPAVAAELTNGYPLIRHFAKSALEAITGRPCDVDVERGDDEIRARAAACVRIERR